MPPLESMACQTPVLTSDRSTMPEVAGDAAILVDVDRHRRHREGPRGHPRRSTTRPSRSGRTRACRTSIATAGRRLPQHLLGAVDARGGVAMKVGFDFRAMQAGHELRGIGEVLRNAVIELDARLPPTDGFVIASEPRPPEVGHLVGRAGHERATHRAGRRPGTALGPPSARPAARQPLDRAAGRRSRPRTCSCRSTSAWACPSTVPTVLFVHDLIPLELGDRYPHRYLAALPRGPPAGACRWSRRRREQPAASSTSAT